MTVQTKNVWKQAANLVAIGVVVSCLYTLASNYAQASSVTSSSKLISFVETSDEPTLSEIHIEARRELGMMKKKNGKGKMSSKKKKTTGKGAVKDIFFSPVKGKSSKGKSSKGKSSYHSKSRSKGSKGGLYAKDPYIECIHLAATPAPTKGKGKGKGKGRRMMKKSSSMSKGSKGSYFGAPVSIP